MPLATRSFFATWLLLGPAVATAAPADVERCRQETEAAARIACLEEALADNQRPPEGRDDIVDGDANKPAAVPPPPAVAPEDHLPPPEPATRDQLTEPLGDEANADGPAEQEPDASELGEEQLRGQKGDDELQRATDLRVRSYEQVPFRRLEVHLENGQVWRQIKGDTQELRASLRKNQTVDIVESALGGYQLRLNEMRRTIRVRRVK